MGPVSIAWAEQIGPWLVTLAVSVIGWAIWHYTHAGDDWQDRADAHFARRHRVDLSSLDRRDGVGTREVHQ